MQKYNWLAIISGAVALTVASCGHNGQQEEVSGPPVNASKPATFDHFTNRYDYRETRDVWYHDQRLDNAKGQSKKIILSLTMQRGRLFVGDKIAMDFPICTGRRSNPTPKGSFSIGEKDIDHVSSSYGTVYGPNGDVVNSDATPSSPVPKGGRYKGADMFFFMRLRGGIGMHTGAVYRDTDSHGCIRIPEEACKPLFNICPSGTPVIIRDSF